MPAPLLRTALFSAALAALLSACSSGGGSDPVAECRPLAAACSTPSECCAPLTCIAGACATAPPACAQEGTGCTGDAQCCTGLVCEAGACATPVSQCTAAGGACTLDAQCCTGTTCSGGADGARTCAVPPPPPPPPPGTCGALNADCTADAQCCSAVCSAGKCTTAEFCEAAGEPCASDAQCCSVSCVVPTGASVGACGAAPCVATGEPAASATDCCSGLLGTGTPALCLALPESGTGATCKTLGEGCGGDLECCSYTCDGGSCVPAFTCNATGDVCYRAEDCCSGLCSGASGAVPGRCDAPSGGCTQDGIPCENDSNCCTKRCLDMGSGTKVCQPAGGCRMTGSYCDGTASCCGGSDPTDPLGTLNEYGIYCDAEGRTPGAPEGDTSTKDERICTGGQACNPPGNICGYKATQNCCYEGGGSGKAVCKPDGGGILRCFGGPVNTTCPTGWDSANPSCCIAEGEVCQFRDQCCGGSPCVPDGAGVLRCAATATCKPLGTPCAGDGDASCCEGSSCMLLEAAWYCDDGGPISTCKPTGNACAADAECCDGQCDTGTCRVCQVEAASCTVDADCCTGLSCAIAPGDTSGTCESGTTTCGASGQGCFEDADCCTFGAEGGDVCLEGVCFPPSPTCGEASQGCSPDAACCAGLECFSTGTDGAQAPCADPLGVGCFCEVPATTCSDFGEACSDTQPCCGGYCATAAGDLCAAGGTGCTCRTAG